MPDPFPARVCSAGVARVVQGNLTAGEPGKSEVMCAALGPFSTGIYLAAFVATIASLLIIGGLLAWRSTPAERWILVLLIVLQLPVSPLLFYGIRVPLDAWIESWSSPETRRLISLFSRPLVEELLKLWPVLLPFVWRSMQADRALGRGLALGLGFGIGELWMLAEIVSRTDPGVANLSIGELFGFINERMMVCVIHGVLSALAIHRFATGLPTAIGLHVVGNVPFYLQEIAAFGLSAAMWTLIIRAWVLWFFFVMCSILWRMVGGDFHLLWLLFGDTTCPSCGMVYPRARFNSTLHVIHQDHCPRCQARNEHS